MNNAILLIGGIALVSGGAACFDWRLAPVVAGLIILFDLYHHSEPKAKRK